MRLLPPILFLTTTALTAQGVVINEFSYNDTGTDDREFVEIFNDTGGPVDLTGWTLEHRDPNGINQIFALASTVLADGGYWVLGSPNVNNVDQIVGNTNILENNNESLTLRDNNNAIVDTLVYEADLGVWDPTLVEGEGLFGDQISEDPFPTSYSRLADGWDTNNNGIDFRLVPESPGLPNLLPLLPPYDENMDGVAPQQPVPHWGGTLAQPVVINPQVPGPFNPLPVPPSPQGGNAAQLGDPNGSNHAMMLCSPMGFLLLEMWVWVDLSQPGSAWSMGVHGHSDSEYPAPDPLNPAGMPDNGDSGLCWTMVCTAPGQGELYLIDNGDGGNDHVVLGSIALQQGVNDGWQRLRMECVDSFAECHFGGTYGQTNGQMIAGDIESEIGGIYFSSIHNGNGPGLIVDHITLLYPDGFMTYAEFGVATSTSLPQISVNQFPRIGEPNFGFRAFDLIPNNLGMFVLGTSELALPLDIIGGTPGTFLWNSGELLAPFFSDPLGEGFLPLPIPPTPSLGGLELSSQAIDFDANLPGGLPLGHSRALDVAFWFFGPPTVKIWPSAALGTNVCVYNYIRKRGGRGPCPLGAAGQICVNCPGPGGCPGPNLRVLVHNLRNVHVCTVSMFRQHGMNCVPQAACPAAASRPWIF